MPSQTKEAIINSFSNLLQKKSFEKITVKDIVEDCGINRKTFYYYFKDIYDLFEIFFRNELENYIDSIPSSRSLEESIAGIFELCEKNRKAVYHIGLVSGDSELKKYLHGIFYETIVKKYKANAAEHGVSEKDFKLLCDVFVMGFFGMLSKWVEGGMKPEYKEDMRRVCIIFGGSIEDMFEKIKTLRI